MAQEHDRSSTSSDPRGAFERLRTAWRTATPGARVFGGALLVWAGLFAFKALVDAIGRITTDATVSAVILIGWAVVVSIGVWWIGRKSFVPWLARRLRLESWRPEDMAGDPASRRLKWSAGVLLGAAALWLFGLLFVAGPSDTMLRAPGWAEGAAMLVLLIGALAAFGLEVLGAISGNL